MSTAIIGFLGGVFGGLLGVGGGIIFVPAMMFIQNINVQKATGTSFLIILFTAASALILKGRAGMIDWKVGLFMGAFALLGGWLGSYLSLKIDTVILHRIFAVFLIVVAVKMFFYKG